MKIAIVLLGLSCVLLGVSQIMSILQMKRLMEEVWEMKWQRHMYK